MVDCLLVIRVLPTLEKIVLLMVVLKGKNDIDQIIVCDNHQYTDDFLMVLSNICDPFK